MPSAADGGRCRTLGGGGEPLPSPPQNPPNFPLSFFFFVVVFPLVLVGFVVSVRSCKGPGGAGWGGFGCPPTALLPRPPGSSTLGGLHPPTAPPVLPGGPG